VTLERRGRIGVLRINNPPVNALSPTTIAAMVRAFDAFEADPSLRALLVHCDGRTFVAGGDITSFDAPDFSAGALNNLLARIERSQRLVVAALHGHCAGRWARVGARVPLPGCSPGHARRLPRSQARPAAGLPRARNACRVWPACRWRSI